MNERDLGPSPTWASATASERGDALSRAHDRLLLLAASEALSAAPSAAAPAGTPLAGKPPTGKLPTVHSNLLALAAVFLVGGIVFAVAWNRERPRDATQRPSDETSIDRPADLPSQDEPQDPRADLPTPVKITAKRGMAAPDPSLRHVWAEFVESEVASLAFVEDLPELEAITLVPQNVAPFAALQLGMTRGNKVRLDADFLQPLAKCGKLRILEVRQLMIDSFGVESLRPLAGLPIERFSFDATGMPGRASTLAGLHEIWPRLRDLELNGVTASRAEWESLGASTGLRRLRLHAPGGVAHDSLAWTHGLDELETLSIVDTIDLRQTRFDLPRWSRAAIESLRELDSLRAIELSGQAFSAEHVDALPRSLRALTLWNVDALAFEVGHAIARLPDLRELRLRTTVVPHIFDNRRILLPVLEAHQLESLEFVGQIHDELATALQRQHVLRRLNIWLDASQIDRSPPALFAWARGLMALETLEVWFTLEELGGDIVRRVFEPLRDVRSLRRVICHGVRYADVEVVREVLGEGVEVDRW